MRYRGFFFLALLLISPLGASAQQVLLSIHKVEGFRNAFWDGLRAGALEEAKVLGLDLKIQGVDPAYEANPAPGQIRVIREALAQGFDSVIVTPGDRLKLAPVVEESVLAGVPVVGIDAPVESVHLSALVATDNYQGGLDAARRMASRLGPKGQLVILSHPSVQNQAIRDRLQAFLSGIKQFGPGVTILSSDTAGRATLESDTVAASQLLTAYPQANGMYCLSGSGTTGALRALQKTGRSTSVVLIGWDGDAESFAGLRVGTVDAILQQDSKTMGARGVRAAWEALQGRAPFRSVLIPATLVTRDTLNDARVVELLGSLGGGAR